MAQVIDMDSLFPKVWGGVIPLSAALVGCTPITFTGDVVDKNVAYRSATTRRKWSEPFGTLTGRMNRHGIHPGEHRYFSLEEMQRGASFPDAFQLTGTPTDRTMRMGNSVPPLFMRAIASQVGKVIFNMPEQPRVKESYPQSLERAWAQHLAPRAADAPTVLSTFAGCGGSSLGYSMAGYREVLAVEWDDNAVATFKLNFPDVPVYHGDITKLSVEQALEMIGMQPGELDVLDGSPPCQGFSTAGKRQMDDPRNQLFREYVRLLRGLQPRAFIMENVSGMVKGKMKLVFVEALKELKASGYRVSARLLNAMYFGVPQSRERLIFIGVREDVGGGEPTHPKAATRPITVREALPDVMHVLGSGHRDNWLGVDMPYPTITKSLGSVSRTAYLSGGHFLRIRDGTERRPTIMDLQTIASYPKVMRFVGDFSTAVERIGNSVPPLFMRAIADHVRTTLLDRPAAQAVPS